MRTLFESLRVPDQQGNYARFTDGSFGQKVNPAFFGLEEIEDRHGGSNTKVVVSISTYLPEPERRDEGASMGYEWDPCLYHDQMLSIQASTEVEYYRFGKPGALDIQPDEWELLGDSKEAPITSTDRTIMKVESAFQYWASHPYLSGELVNCARSLVMRRRRRSMSTSQWEVFATGAMHKCPRQSECGSTDFYAQDDLQSHLSTRHSRDESGANREVLQNIFDSVMKDWRARGIPHSQPTFGSDLKTRTLSESDVYVPLYQRLSQSISTKDKYTEANMSSIHDAIKLSKLSPSFAQVQIIVECEILQCFSQQYDENFDLNCLMVVTGGPCHAWATTCSTYFEFIWPESGIRNLEVFKEMLKEATEHTECHKTRHETNLKFEGIEPMAWSVEHNSHFVVNLRGPQRICD